MRVGGPAKPPERADLLREVLGIPADSAEAA